MHRNRPSFSRTSPRAIRKGTIVVGLTADGQRVCLTVRDRSVHVFIVGGTGSGKTTLLKIMAGQDARAGRGFALIDPNADLYVWLKDYLCYLRGIGYRVPEVILFNPSDPDWVTPFNPFRPMPGDLSTQVDRRVDATLRAWGQQTGDDTPRLAKWLKVLYTALIQCNLTILEAGYLIDQQAGAIRAFLLRDLRDPFVRSKLEQLAQYKTSDFYAQMDSVENRLMRSLCSDVVRRTMGVGTNALDYTAIMEEGKILLVNLGLGDCVSEEQQRLFGTMLISEFFEVAMRRQTGSRPYYLYIDEAGLFVTPELGKALDQCRKKGLHVTLAAQHLGQFREDPKLYKSIKNNARNKIVFAVPDRPDASELADDLFTDLTALQVKYVRKHLTHLIRDVRQTSRTQSVATSDSHGTSSTRSTTTGHSRGRSEGVSNNSSTASQRAFTVTDNESQGQSWEEGDGETFGYAEQESHGWGDSQTTSYQRTSGSTDSWGTSTGTSTSSTRDHEGHSSDSYSSNQGRSSSNTSSEAETWGDSTTHSYQESLAATRSHGRSTSRSQGSSRSRGAAWSRQDGTSRARGSSSTRESSESESFGESEGTGTSSEYGKTVSTSVTNQPGTRHIPFWEEQREHWSLEERRWQAAELLMRQPTGHCFIKTVNHDGLRSVMVPAPRKFYARPTSLLKFSQQFLQKHCIPREQAERIIQERHARLEAQATAPQPPDSGRPPRREKRGRSKPDDEPNLFEDVLGRE